MPDIWFTAREKSDTMAPNSHRETKYSMKRKWLAALLAASLLLSLTGCGGGDSTESTSQTLSQSEQEVTQPVTSEPEYNEDADTIQTAPVKSLSLIHI